VTSRKKRILWSILVVIALSLPGLVWIGYMASPTSGQPIHKYSSPRSALVLIDLQEDCTGTMSRPPFPYRNSTVLIAQANRAIQTAETRKVNMLKDAIGLLKEEKWTEVLSDYERRGMHLVTVADYK